MSQNSKYQKSTSGSGMLCGNAAPPGMPGKYSAAGLSTAEMVEANGNNTTVSGVANTVYGAYKSPSSKVSKFTSIMD